jgi:hypothetical protein
MSRFRKSITQGGVDTFTSEPIPTGITPDGKQGLQITAISAFWVNGSDVAAADWSMSARVATVDSLTGFGTADEVERVAWGLQNTGGVAVAEEYEPIKTAILFEPRLTVQPNIYIACDSLLTAQANNVIFIIYYELVKLTDLEVLRLLQGGA